jgi:hypothetical protein
VSFYPRCQETGCEGRMSVLDPATLTLLDEEIWFQCEQCGTHTHSANLDVSDNNC